MAAVSGFYITSVVKETDMDNKINLDILDLMMIKELQDDGRIPIRALAKKIGTSRATAHRRLAKLVRNGVVQIFARVDPSCIGYFQMLTIGINTHPGAIDTVADMLAEHPHVHFMSICTGRYDIIIWAVFKEPNQVSRFLREQLGNISGIARSETMTALEVKKSDYRYLKDEDISEKQVATSRR